MAVREEAYTELSQILETYKKRMINLEKQRLTKQRVFYLREENQIKYEQSLEKMKLVEGDVTDNLTKMTRHILNPEQELMQKFVGFALGSGDEEEGIEERIAQVRARELLEAWKKIQVQAENELGGAGAHDQLLAQENRLKDRLFIETGEDIDDTFAAFKHYGLDPKITDEDRKNYGN